jgi:putative SOS response-associated peptidase YedK
MCGRFVRRKEIDTLASEFGIDFAPSVLAPSYNVAPTQQVAVIVEHGFKMLIERRWGLVPSWAC